MLDHPPDSPVFSERTEYFEMRIFRESELLENPWRNAPSLLRPRQQPSALLEHAEPLFVLRDRDWNELINFFDRPEMPEIEQELDQCLHMMFPAPYWEDEEKWQFIRDWLE
ncbi:hypothetical protein ACN4EG_11555 [Alkalinema pantanalense CENA528]|uniref:hypothetical protein n=1 Tax=Alkalinema pantanalense TaxID=1620705 RepID=UPI003D6E80F2